jgi:hypothetical protein
MHFVALLDKRRNLRSVILRPCLCVGDEQFPQANSLIMKRVRGLADARLFFYFAFNGLVEIWSSHRVVRSGCIKRAAHLIAEIPNPLVYESDE